MTRAVEEKQQKKDHILLPLRHSTTVCEIFKRKSVNDFIPILSLHIQLNRPLERGTFIAYRLHSYRFVCVCVCVWIWKVHEKANDEKKGKGAKNTLCL